MLYEQTTYTLVASALSTDNRLEAYRWGRDFRYLVLVTTMLFGIWTVGFGSGCGEGVGKLCAAEPRVSCICGLQSVCRIILVGTCSVQRNNQPTNYATCYQEWQIIYRCCCQPFLGCDGSSSFMVPLLSQILSRIGVLFLGGEVK